MRDGPDVVLDVELVDGGFFLVLVNIGGAVARDVTVQFRPGLIGVDGQKISELAVWKRLRTLRPGREIRVFYDTMHAILARPRLEQQFSAVVSWKLGPRQSEKETYAHDLGAFAGLRGID